MTFQQTADLVHADGIKATHPLQPRESKYKANAPAPAYSGQSCLMPIMAPIKVYSQTMLSKKMLITQKLIRNLL